MTNPQLSQFWAQGYLNIYFCGSLDSWFEKNTAFSYDPSELPRFGIMMGDFGYMIPSGFPPDPANRFDPPNQLQYNVLEHEFIHVLARFKNRSFSGGSTYDDREHSTNSAVILGPCDPLNPDPSLRVHRLYVPGASNDPTSELGELLHRVRNGTWDQP